MVCSTRTGSVGTNAVAHDLAAYYAGEQTVAIYYGRQGDIRADVSAAMSDRLGLDATRPAAQAEVASLMLGERADGQEIKGRAPSRQPGWDTSADSICRFHVVGQQDAVGSDRARQDTGGTRDPHRCPSVGRGRRHAVR